MKGTDTKSIMMKWNNHHINILGEEYTIVVLSREELDTPNALAYTDSANRKIVLNRDSDYEVTNPEFHIKSTIRHEIVHAFLYESGLDTCSHAPEAWGRSEEIVDWIAIQSPKMCKVFVDHKLL